MISYKQYLLEGMKWPQPDSIERLFMHAKRNRGKRLPKEKEDIIRSSTYWTLRYIEEILHNRWPEAEEGLMVDGRNWLYYLEFLYRHHYPVNIMRSWIEKEGSSKTLPEILLYIGIPPDIDIQEYIIKNRPDLINKIKDLCSELKEKYNHEYSVGNLDI